MVQFVSLHVHTYYSLLDGLSSPKSLVARAKELGHPAIAVSDHGVLHAGVELYRECLKESEKSLKEGGQPIKSIIGCEAYVKDQHTTDQLKDFVKESDGDYRVKGLFHQLILAINPTGYKNLCKLVSLAHLTEGRGAKNSKSDTSTKSKSWMLLDELKQYSEGLIVTSGCMAGIIPQSLLAGDVAYAEEMAKWYLGVFGDRFYMEIQDHNAPDGSQNLNLQLVALAEKLNIEVVVTADNHYTCASDREAHDALLCINTGKLLTDSKRMRYEGAYWLPTGDEMVERLSKYLPVETALRAVENTVKIAERVEDYQLKRKPTPPKFTLPEGYSSHDDYFTKLVWEGLEKRLEIILKQPNHHPREEYIERVKYELDTIKEMGFSQYFLVVWDVCSYAYSKGIWLGIGRGSVGGCLVAYALRITNIDPIPDGLIFERFLNNARVSMPDIDTDICQERRQEVIAYLQERYGFEYVAQIATFNKLKTSAALKATAKTMNVNYQAINAISKKIPTVRGKKAKLKQLTEKRDIYPEFYDYYHSDELLLDKDGNKTVSFRSVVDTAASIEGTVSAVGIHAAGVVVGWCPLDEIMPLMRGSNGEVVSQYCDKDIEEIGGIKIDWLGLKTLTVMRKAIESVYQRTGEEVDLADISYTDKRVFQYMASGNTEGIFQFEGYGGQLLKELRVDGLNLVCAANTLNRPQCIDPKIDRSFIRRNSRLDAVSYLVPDLEPILKETLGLPIYQEQLLKICQVIAGFSLGEADNIRRGIGKKLEHVINALEHDFLEGCSNNWYDEAIGKELWSIIKAGSDYGFNKSHSMAYGIIAYQTAYLKYYFFADYMAALCTMESKPAKLRHYLMKIKVAGVALLTPDINQSGKDFTVIDNMTIRWGLGAIDGMGDSALNPILLERQLKPFDSFFDFYDRTRLDSDILIKLIKSGALDSLHPNRSEMLAYAALLADKWLKPFKSKERRMLKWESKAAELNAIDIDTLSQEDCNAHVKELAKIERYYQKACEVVVVLPPMPTVEDWSLEQRLNYEKEVLGMFGSGHPLDRYPVGCIPFEEAQKNKIFISTLQVNSFNEGSSSQGKMLYVEVEDRLGAIMTLKLFNRQYKQYGHLFKVNEHLSIHAKCQEWKGELQLILETALKPTPPEGEQKPVVMAWEDDEF